MTVGAGSVGWGNQKHHVGRAHARVGLEGGGAGQVLYLVINPGKNILVATEEIMVNIHQY